MSNRKFLSVFILIIFPLFLFYFSSPIFPVLAGNGGNTPQYFDNSTNSTVSGEPVEFRLRWTDTVGLSGHIFSFWNGSDLYRTPASVHDFCGETQSASNTIDDSLSTYWTHFAFGEHWIVYDLGVEANITKFRIYSPNPSSIGWAPCHVNEIYISNDPNDWGSSLGECSLYGPSGNTWRECNGNHFTSKSGRYINITLNATASSSPYTCENQVLQYFYEFDVYTSGLMNDTWDNTGWDSTEEWSNVTKVINSTVGATIKWRVYANDTSDNWNASDVYSFMTTETNPPTYSNDATNITTAGQSCNFALDWNDDYALSPGGGYVFSTNNSGTWENASWTAFTSTPQTAQNGTVLNSTVGALVQWKFYANDTFDNWNVSETYSLTTSSTPYFSNNQVNTSMAGAAANFTIDLTDNNPLDSTAGYIFSTNNSGTWENASYVPFTGSSTTQTAWNVTVLNSTVGALVQWKFYANDTDGIWIASDTYSLTVVPADYCDVPITSLPYTINQNNIYYCLDNDFNIDPGYGNGAVEFNTNIENSTLDCLGYNLNGTDATNRFGVETDYNVNITIKNCDISNFYYGITDDYSNYTTIIDNTFVSNDYSGIRLYRSLYSNITGNTFEDNHVYDIQAFGSHAHPGYHNIENNYMVGGSSTYGIFSETYLEGCIIKNNTIVTAAVSSSIRFADDYCINNTIANNTLDTISFSDARNNTIENNTVKTIKLSYSAYGIPLGAAFNTIKNNIVKDGDGIIIEGSEYNTLINNTVFNTSNGIYIDTYSASTYSENNNITGGSVHNNTYDYRIDGGTTNYFRNTNFTGSRKIYFDDVESWFSYNNDSSGELWLKNNVSAAVTLTRKLTNWGQSIVQWNDSSDSPVTATYNMTGLSTNKQYYVYNDSSLIYTLQTDSSGSLNFSIYLSSEHEIKVQAKEFKPSGTLISTTRSEPWYITQVIPTWSSNEPTDTSITVYVSANGGTDWEQVTNGITHTFLNQGKDFKYKVVFQTSDILVAPTLYDVNFFYTAIPSETITIRTEVSRNVYVGFFDITLIGSETTYKDKFQKSYTLP